jgi:hypothetical protein
MNPAVEAVLSRLSPKARAQAEAELARQGHPDFAGKLPARAPALPVQRAPEPDMSHDPYDVTGGQPVAVKRKGKAKAQAPAKLKKQRVQKTRNSGTWTEAEYWQRIRSCLRKMSMFWKPAREALIASRIPCKGPRGQKWAYVCSDCGKVYHRKQVHIDHIIPCGNLTSHECLGEFVRKLLPEDKAAFAVRCVTCHQAKTNSERVRRKEEECISKEDDTEISYTQRILEMPFKKGVHSFCAYRLRDLGYYGGSPSGWELVQAFDSPNEAFDFVDMKPGIADRKMKWSTESYHWDWIVMLMENPAPKLIGEFNELGTCDLRLFRGCLPISVVEAFNNRTEVLIEGPNKPSGEPPTGRL